MTSVWWQPVSREQYGCRVYLPVFFHPVESWASTGGLTDKGPAGWSGGGGLDWAMDALSIMAALGGGLRSRHGVVRERWSVRSQHSLTTPDPSFRQEQHRIYLCVDSWQNGFFHSGQRGKCWPRVNDYERARRGDNFWRIWGINTIKNRV